MKTLRVVAILVAAAGSAWAAEPLRTTRAQAVKKLRSRPKDVSSKALSENATLWNELFAVDAHIELYGELPVTAPKGFDTVRAWLANEAQDVGPFPPQLVLVFAAKGDDFQWLELDAKPAPGEIGECTSGWDEALKRLGTKSTMAGEDAAFRAYGHCYAEHARTSKASDVWARQAQAALDALAAGKPSAKQRAKR